MGSDEDDAIEYVQGAAVLPAPEQPRPAADVRRRPDLDVSDLDRTLDG
jgi:hypothetical protein